jgi:hypothetical protein
MGMASWGGFSRGLVLSGNEVGAEMGIASWGGFDRRLVLSENEVGADLC